MDPNLMIECGHDGNGYSIDFPVRAKAVLKKTKKDYFFNDDDILTLSPRYVIEMATFYIKKIL